MTSEHVSIREHVPWKRLEGCRIQEVIITPIFKLPILKVITESGEVRYYQIDADFSGRIFLIEVNEYKFVKMKHNRKIWKSD